MAKAGKKLKLGKNKIIAGVCSGVAEYFEVDTALVRILWVLLTILSIGVGIIAYIVAWFFMKSNT
jgi:phage shock protein PspC (stress-responsive transcriptional regulator)